MNDDHSQGEGVPSQFQTKNGWVVFEIPAGSQPLTGKTLDEWLQPEHEDEYRRAFSPKLEPCSGTSIDSGDARL